MQEVEVDHEMATQMREMIPMAVRWFLGEIEEVEDDMDDDDDLGRAAAFGFHHNWLLPCGCLSPFGTCSFINAAKMPPQ